MKTKMLIALALTLTVCAVPADFKAPLAYAAGAEAAVSEETGQDGKEMEKNEKVKEDIRHNDEGMHGMVGHHSKGWVIVIGVIMVVMMSAMVL